MEMRKFGEPFAIGAVMEVSARFVIFCSAATQVSRLLFGKVALEFAVGVAERREVIVDL